MPELRKDPIVGRWVIISSERGKRPSDWTNEPNIKVGGFCPFCPGNEDKTPPEIMAFRNKGKANERGWKIRVVSNKFPALKIEGNLSPKGIGIYDMMEGIGAHEVIIETPEHAADLSDLPDEHVADVLFAFRSRTVDLKKDERFKYILIFKNHGVAAGASLDHTHSQLIATPIIPKRVVEELDGSKLFYDRKERCVFCDIVNQELNAELRVVSNTDSFIVLEPFAPRFPFETWILPIKHYSHFESMPDSDYYDLAKVLKDTLSRINQTLGYPPYNFILHTSPIQGSNLPHYHWHFEIIPKLTKVAGFEWGSGFYINPTPPEQAAKSLRRIENEK